MRRPENMRRCGVLILRINAAQCRRIGRFCAGLAMMDGEKRIRNMEHGGSTAFPVCDVELETDKSLSFA